MNTKHDWVRLISDYHASGLTQKEFCLQQRVDLEQFKWRLRLSRKETKPTGDFVQLSVAAPISGLPEVELHFPNGLFLRFSGDVRPDYLRDLLAGLRS